MRYRLLVAWDVVEFVERLPKRIGRQMRNAIAAIGIDPEENSDAEDSDDTGRRLDIAIVGDFAITYWIDHADRHVKILDIRSADY